MFAATDNRAKGRKSMKVMKVPIKGTNSNSWDFTEVEAIVAMYNSANGICRKFMKEPQLKDFKVNFSCVTATAVCYVDDVH